MKTPKLVAGLCAALFLSLAASSCGKDDDSSPTPGNPGNPSTGRKVRYEITGNYTGKFRVGYNIPSGPQSIEVSSLPWSYEMNITSVPASAYLIVNHITGSNPGVAGQTATSSIKLNGEVKQTSTQTANTDGYIYLIPSLTYAIQ